jgi:hypothetical protein
MNGGSPREPPLPRVAVGGMTTAGANSRHMIEAGSLQPPVSPFVPILRTRTQSAEPGVNPLRSARPPVKEPL